MSWKRITSVVILLCMLMSMFAMPMTSAASVDTADTGANVDLSDTGANTDIANTGANVDVANAGASYGLVSDVQQGQILQCWNWSYNNIKKNLEKIAEQGFSAIQTSPLQPIKETTCEYWNTVMNSSWVVYQPVAFNLEDNYRNVQGTAAEFKAMCTEAHKYGIKVIVDTIFNHMANDMSGNTIHPWVPFKDDPSCWHDITKNTYNFSDRYEVTQYCLTGLPDLNTASTKVQNYCIQFMKDAIDAGADGFRFDAIKHVETPDDYYTYASNFWPNVLNAATSYAKSTRGFTPYYYGELIGDPGGGLSAEIYTKYMSVTATGASDTIRGGVCDSNASNAASGNYGYGVAPSKAVIWTESHDNHKDNGTNMISDLKINQVWAMAGSRAEACGMYLARPENMNTTMMGDADWTSWVAPEVKAVNQFKNHFVGQSEYLSSYYNLACVERGNSGMIIVNTGGTYYNGMKAPVHTMASGTYKDAITGNTFTVADGWISGDIGDTGIAVVYNLSNSGSLSTGNLTEYSLVGGFNNWDANTNKFIANDSKTATTTVVLEAGTYEFKLKTTGDLWYGNTGTISDTASGWVFSTSVGDNCKIKASGGRYSFTYDTTTRKLSVSKISSSTTSASSYYLKGDFNSWGTDNAMKYVEGQNAVTTTLSLDAGKYTFKINKGDIWYGNWGTIVDTTVSTAETGWEMDPNPSVGNCTLEATAAGTYTFTFNLSTQKLIVTSVSTVTATFKDWDGTVISTQSVKSGTAPTAPTNPTRTGYIFKGWSPAIGAITKNTTYTATYNVMSYSVSASSSPKAGGTTTSSASSVNYGSTVTFTANADTANNYSFTNWQITGAYTITSGSLASTSITIAPTSAITAVANYTQAATYTVSVSAGTGGTASASAAKVVDGNTVTFTASPSKGYKFSKWSISGTYTTVSGSLTSSSITIKPASNVTATASFTGHSSIVKFASGTGGSVTNTASATITYPNARSSTATASTGYTFSKWTISGGTLDTDYEITSGSTTSTTIAIRPLTSDKNITATASFTGNASTVKFVAGTGGSVTNSGSNSVTYPSTKTSTATAGTGYNFSNWTISGGTQNTDYKITSGSTSSTSITIQVLTADKTITATANFSLKTYVVTFLNWDGTVLATRTVNHGSAASAPSNPTRTGYVFKGWDTDFSNVTSNMNVTAQFADDTVFLLGSFNDWDIAKAAMTKSSGNIVTATYELSAGEYSFKVLHQDVWYGNNGTIEDTTTATSSIGWEMVDGADNCTLKTSGGKYTFNYNKSTKFIEVLYEAPEYTVTFLNYNGTTISTQKVAKGEAAKAPADPVRNATAQYTYTFKGWDKDFSNIQSDLTVSAVFDAKLNSYKVTFKDYDGTVLKTQTVDYGSAATAPDTPTRPSNAQYTYTFKAWDKSFSRITGETVVTATYSQTVNKYKVTFKNWNGVVLSTQTVEYGSAATAPADPTRDGYIFTGWDNDFSKITGELTVIAQFTDGNVYLLGSFNDWSTANGAMGSASGDVVSKRLKLEAGTYTFKILYKDVWYGNWGTIEDTTTATSATGWEMVDGASDCTLTASGGTYTFNFNTSTKMLEVLYVADGYTVTFKNYDGTVLKTDVVAKGSAATAPATPTRPSTAQYTYTFAGWDVSFDNIQADTVVTATYTQVLNKYTVTFKDYDGSVITTQQVEYGKAATAPATPTREATAQYTYTFKSWDKAFTNITADTVVTATYTQTVRKYTVTFLGYDGAKLSTQTVEYGKSATAPTAPAVDGFEFTGWDKEFANITGDLTVNAQYKDAKVYLLGSFNDWQLDKVMTTTSGNVVTAKLTLAPGTYKFKILHKDVWYGNNGTIEDTTLATSEIGWEMVDGADDCTLVATGGNYTFNYNTSTKMLEVLYLEDGFTVTFKNYDGTVLKTEIVKKGASATAPEPPVRASNAQYTYTFSGWSTDFSNIQADTVVTAQFTRTVNKYTVTFKNYDDSVISTQSVEYGSAAIAPANPTRESSAQYTYVFSGWDTAYNYITADTVVKANFVQTLRKYTVKFVNYDDSVLATQQVEYGKSAVAPANPKREASAQYSYTFKGWDKAFSNITADTIVKATYTQTVNKYTVTFVDWNGTVLKTETVEYGKSATAPKDPVRQNDDYYTYTFTGWDMSFTNIKGNLTVTAMYEASGAEYMVVFLDLEGELISEQYVMHGQSAVAPEPPEFEGMVFIGWDTDFSYIESDTIVFAEYAELLVYLPGDFNDWDSETEMEITESPVVSTTMELEPGTYRFKVLFNDIWYGNWGTIEDTTLLTSAIGWEMTEDADDCTLVATGGTYTFTFNAQTRMLTVTCDMETCTVTFQNWDGSVLKTEVVKKGADATAPANPTRDANAQYTFTFKGWDKDFRNVQSDIVVKATYTQTVNKYKVTFKNYDGSTIVEQTVEYGKSAIAPDAPTREANAQYTYSFKAWDTAFDNITKDTVVTATYTQTINKYKVTFKDWDGKVLSEQTVEYGSAATAPTAPAREATEQYTYTFSGWDTAFDSIVKDTVVTANYTQKAKSFQVVFKNWDGTILSEQDVEYGKSATAPETPERAGTDKYTYTFKGWDVKFDSIVKDTVVTAVFEENVNKFIVVFFDSEGNLLSEQEVEYGKSAVAPEAPAVEGMVFKGWDTDFSYIISDTVVTAEYAEISAYLPGDFNDWDSQTAMESTEGSIVSVTMTLEEGEYKFKVLMNDVWYGNWGVIEDTTLATSEIGWEMDSDADNCTLKASGGTYTFNFNTETKFLEIIFKAPEYKVNFIDWDGSLLKSETVERGKSATAPEAPSREGYDFRGWDKDFTNIQGNTVVTAVYQEIISEYTVKFVNYDGTLLSTQVVKRGESATAPDAPSREANAQYTFTFKGWDTDFTNVTGDLTVKAQYNSVLNKYTVIFTDYDGTVLKTESVDYGTAATAPETAKRDGYVFTGWDAEFESVTENITVTAVYAEDIVYLVGSFNEWEATTALNKTESQNIVSVTIELPEGTHQFKVLYLDNWFGNNGTIEDTTLATSEIGWEMTAEADDCTLVASGGTYTFNFNKATNMLEVIYTAPKYTVKFLDWNGTLLKEEVVEKGKTATAPDDPTREGYVFTGWNKELTNIQADTIITATYILESITYTVTFLDWDGTVLKTEIVTTGETATAPDDPTRENYKFIGWDKPFNSITYNLTVNALYMDMRTYLVGSFNEWATDTVMTQVEDSDIVSVEVTLKAGEYSFKLIHNDVWYGNTGVIEDTTTATSEIGWEMADGVDNCTLKASGGKYTFNFNTETKFLEVLYTPVEYTVTFLGFGGTELSKQTVKYGAKAEAPEAPQVEGYLFSKWDSQFDCIEADTTVTAVYVENDTEFTVTFVDWNGKVLSTQTVGYGEYAVPPTPPTRDGYVFTGWDKDFTVIKSDLTVNAQYKENLVYLMGDFNNWEKDIVLVPTNDEVAYELTLAKGEYQFKYVNFDIWYGNAGVIEDTTLASSETGWIMYENGDNCTLKASGGKYTFIFNIKTVTLEIFYTPVEYTVTFLGFEGTELSKQTVKLGADATAPEAPAVEGYIFSGWDTDFTKVEANTVVNAVYLKDDSKFTVTFTDYDGTVISTQEVQYGEAAEAPEDPVRVGYLFTGWDKKFDKITENTTIVAQYKDNQIYLVGSWSEWDTDLYLTRIEDSNIFSATIVLDAGSYYFKLLQNDVWYTNASTIIDTTVVTSETGIEFKSDSSMGDTILNASGGAYTFRFNVLTNELEVLYSNTVYTVTFLDFDGTVLSEQKVPGGMSATAPEAPVREGDVQYSYTFNGWDTDFTNVQSDLTVTATYLQALNKFTVTFVDDDGTTVLGTSEVEYGQAAQAPEVPDKDGLIFAGWDKEFTTVTENMTVTAKYMQGVASNVTIAGTFNGWDPAKTPLYYSADKDKVTVKLTLAAGSYQFKIVEDGGTWYGNNGTIQNTTGEYGWVMSTSDGDCTLVAEGGEYLFTYTISTKTLQVGPAGAEFTVKFVDWDGTVLKTEVVYSGNAATAPETPSREGYTFVGWSADFSKVFSNLTVTATYLQGSEVYKVTFVDTDGTILSETYAAKGKSAKAPQAPVKSGYIFNGWDKSFTNVTSDMTVTAKYLKGTTSKVSIAGTFNGWNPDATPFLQVSGTNKVSLQMNLSEGTYQFKVVNNGEWLGNWGTIADTTVTTSATGWEMDAAAGDCTFIAGGGTYIFTYTPSANVLEVKYMGSEYKVTFVDWDGTVLKTEIVEPGGSATPPNVTLTRPADDNYTYTWKGWDMKYTNVQAPLRVTAVYNANPKTFTVKFVNWNGAVLSTQYVKYGSAATHPGDPVRAGYIFTGWDGDINYITGNTTFTAQYADNGVYIMGDFNDWQGTKLSNIGGTIYQGKLTLAEGQYKFKVKQGNDWYGNNGWIDDTTDYTSETGWDMSWDAGDCTLNASGSTYTFKFNSETKKLIITYVAPTYTVTFKNWNGTILKTQYVKRGNPAYAPAEPTRTGYVFTGWDQDFSWISANMVITAQFAENTVSVMGDFNDWQGTGMINSTGSVFTKSIELEAGSYKFKIKHADTWYGNNGTIDNSTVATSAVGWEMVWDAGDCTLNATGGTYTFKFNTETRMLEIFYEGPVFTVTFLDWDGSIIEKQQVEYGKSATAPQIPEREGFTFSGWSADFSFITGNTTIMAQYGDEAVYLRGTFNNWELSSPMRGSDEPKVYSYVMELEAGEYTFKVFTSDIWYGNNGTIEDTTVTTSEVGWEMDGSAGDCKLVAQGGTYLFIFNTETRMLQVLKVEAEVAVTFVNWDGTVLSTQNVKFGTAAVPPTDFSRPGYTFVGWDQDINYVTGAMTVTALYRKTVILDGSFTEEGGAEMLPGEETSVYEVTVDIQKGTHTFEVSFGGEMYGICSTFGDNINGVVLMMSPDKCTMIASGGQYKFSFNIETFELNVEKISDEVSSGDEASPDEPELPVTHKVTFNESENFTIITDADINAIEDGSSFSFTVKVKEGYILNAVVYNMSILTAADGVFTIDNITSDVVLIIVAIEDTVVSKPMEFTVQFTDKDGNVLKTETVEYGKSAEAPEAPAVEGYTFKGWDTEFDYVTKDITVKATYKKITAPVQPPTTGSLRIEIAGGTGFTISVNGGAARPQGNTYANTNMSIGATVTVIAQAAEGATFLGWINPLNGQVLSKELTYTFVTGGNDLIKASFVTEAEGAQLVIFKNDKAAGGKGRIIDMQYYASADSIVFPDNPTQVGFDFAGWNMTEAEIKAAIARGEDVTVLATWTKQIVYVNLTVNGGTGGGKVEANFQTTVTANAAPEGKKFAYWVDGNGNIKSYQAEYKLFPVGDMTLTAVFVDADAVITEQILVSLDGIDTVSVEGKDVFYYSWYVPSEYTFVKVGIIAVNKANYNEATFVAGTSDSNVYDRSPGSPSTSGAFSWTKSNVAAGQTWVAKAYVQYRDAQGQLVTVYSDMVEATKD